MKKYILFIIALFTAAPLIAQDTVPQEWSFRSRVLQVDQANVAAFEKAVAKKNKNVQ